MPGKTLASAIQIGDPVSVQKAIRTLKDEGYAMTSIYHYMGSGGRAQDPRHFSFDLVAASNLEHWQGLQKTGILPFLPNLSTGWDDRPWHGDGALVIDGRTVPLFRRICEDAKRFADTTGIKLLSLGPLNEWGEGSYAEPCAEFGFGMYDQVREVFYGPADVGLGPYDYPEMTPVRRTAWDFSTGPEGWSALMAMEAPQVKDGVLSAVTTGPDPALGATLGALNAWQLRKLTFRMRLTGPVNAGDNGQLFWNLGRGVSEALSQRFPVTADGQWHEYTLDLGANPRWRGLVRSLRFDPCNARGVTVELAAVKFE